MATAVALKTTSVPLTIGGNFLLVSVPLTKYLHYSSYQCGRETFVRVDALSSDARPMFGAGGNSTSGIPIPCVFDTINNEWVYERTLKRCNRVEQNALTSGEWDGYYI